MLLVLNPTCPSYWLPPSCGLWACGCDASVGRVTRPSACPELFGDIPLWQCLGGVVLVTL